MVYQPGRIGLANRLTIQDRRIGRSLLRAVARQGFKIDGTGAVPAGGDRSSNSPAVKTFWWHPPTLGSWKAGTPFIVLAFSEARTRGYRALRRRWPGGSEAPSWAFRPSYGTRPQPGRRSRGTPSRGPPLPLLP